MTASDDTEKEEWRTKLNQGIDRFQNVTEDKRLGKEDICEAAQAFSETAVDIAEMLYERWCDERDRETDAVEEFENAQAYWAQTEHALKSAQAEVSTVWCF